ncbi:MAG: ArsR family transcriptional regulator [Candidatus Bathyarchaeia archaeon]
MASSCRRKILTALAEKKELTIMKLVQMVNSTYNEVDRNLRVLEQEGIISQSYAEHKRIIRLNYENEETLVLLKIL